jgi:DNA-binding protein HU-beta
MNKSDLIACVFEKTNLTKTDSEKAIDAVFESIIEALKKEEEIRLTGFATFSIVHRPTSEGRNPRTGEPITIPPRKSVKFRPSKVLKDALA